MKTAEKYLLGAGFLALPFVFSVSGAEQMREPKAHFLAVLGGLFLSLAVARRVSFSLGCAAGVVYLFSLTAMRFPIEELLTFSAALGSCLLVAQATENDVNIGLELLEAAGVATAAYAMLLQFKGGDPIQTMVAGNDFRRVSVFFGQHTLYGPFCVAAAAPALFRGRFFKALLIAMPIPFIDASFTYLAAGVVVAIYLIRLFDTKAILGLVLMGVVAGGVVGSYYRDGSYVNHEELNDNGRFALWKCVWRIARVHPYAGHGGLGSFAMQFPIFQSAELRKKMGLNENSFSPEAKIVLKEAEALRNRSGWFLSAHNEFLQAFYEFGILGLFFALLLPCVFVFYWVLCPDTPESWALAAIFFSFMANSLGNFPLHLIPQALLPLWSFVAVTSLAKGGNLKA